MSHKFDKICFGGSFDPIHKGHVDAVSITLRAFADSSVLVVPSYMTPKSSDQLKTISASFQDRVAMAALAFDDFSRVDVSSIEEDLKTPSYTYQTILALKAEHKWNSIAWMIGADQLTEFLNWKNPKVILESCSLIVVPRPDSVASNLFEIATKHMNQLGFDVSNEVASNCLKLSSGTSIFILSEAPKSVSSSHVRQWIKNQNVKELKHNVPIQVVDYLLDGEIYVSL
jgi:nicotinate-nucleotide adenylyltransferase